MFVHQFQFYIFQNFMDRPTYIISSYILPNYLKIIKRSTSMQQLQ